MGNRIEAPLSNQTFQDVTAWRAIRNADRSTSSLQTEFHPQSSTLCQNQPDIHSGREKKKLKRAKITELQQALAEAKIQAKEGKITWNQLDIIRQELVPKLHVVEKRGHKSN